MDENGKAEHKHNLNIDEDIEIPEGVDPSEILLDTVEGPEKNIWLWLAISTAFVFLLIALFALVPQLRFYINVWLLGAAIICIVFAISSIFGACIFAFLPLVNYIREVLSTFFLTSSPARKLSLMFSVYQHTCSLVDTLESAQEKLDMRLSQEDKKDTTESDEAKTYLENIIEKARQLKVETGNDVAEAVKDKQRQMEFESRVLRSRLSIEKARLFSRTPKVLLAGVFVVMGFGVLFFGINLLTSYLGNTPSFITITNDIPNLLQSLYFSLLTFTMTGSIDMYASHWSSQVAVSVETIIGYIYLVAIVTVSIALLTDKDPIEVARSSRQTLQDNRDHMQLLNIRLNSRRSRIDELNTRLKFINGIGNEFKEWSKKYHNLV